MVPLPSGEGIKLVKVSFCVCVGALCVRGAHGGTH